MGSVVMDDGWMVHGANGKGKGKSTSSTGTGLGLDWTCWVSTQPGGLVFGRSFALVERERERERTRVIGLSGCYYETQMVRF